jgi:outer membrane protein assembly factor BamB
MPISYGRDFDEMVRCNKLVAVNLEVGKLAWKAGGRRKAEGFPRVFQPAPVPVGPVPAPAPAVRAAPKDDEPETAVSLLTDAYFLGAPLPLDGKLYVVIEKDSKFRLVCLDPNKVVDRNPQLLWSQLLGAPKVPLPADTLRRIQGISLASAGNMLVVPTNAGSVLGVDRLSHNIVWTRPYRSAQAVTAAPPDPKMTPAFPRRGSLVVPGADQQFSAGRWRISAPMISGDKVVFTAWDFDSVMCLNLRDGKVFWEVKRGGDDLYVAAVADNKVIVAGKNDVKFLDLSNGSNLGIVSTATPSGMGALSNGVYYLPVRPSRDNPEPEILSIDVKEMMVTAHTRSRKQIPIGNLMFFDGALYSQTPFNLTSFPQLDSKIKEVKK